MKSVEESYQAKVLTKYPKAQCEQRKMGIPWKGTRNYFIVVAEPWGMELGKGRTEGEAWTEALLFLIDKKDEKVN